jgi:uncharacterized protein YndB with AHSA1/START domain
MTRPARQRLHYTSELHSILFLPLRTRACARVSPQPFDGHANSADVTEMTMRLSATTHIAASAASIWDVLTDYSDHETWNPFVVSATEVTPNRLEVMIDPDPEDRLFGCEGVVRNVEQPTQFDIDLHFGPPILLNAKYRATLTASGGGTLLEQNIRFGGPLRGYYIRKSFLAKMQRGLEAMGAALKRQFELPVPMSSRVQKVGSLNA